MDLEFIKNISIDTLMFILAVCILVMVNIVLFKQSMICQKKSVFIRGGAESKDRANIYLVWNSGKCPEILLGAKDGKLEPLGGTLLEEYIDKPNAIFLSALKGASEKSHIDLMIYKNEFKNDCDSWFFRTEPKRGNIFIFVDKKPKLKSYKSENNELCKDFGVQWVSTSLLKKGEAVKYPSGDNCVSVPFYISRMIEENREKLGI